MATGSGGHKTGTSDECKSILGLVAEGDCSIASAKKNGHISKVSTVDWKGTNLFGLIYKGHTVITGQ